MNEIKTEDLTSEQQQEYTNIVKQFFGNISYNGQKFEVNDDDTVETLVKRCVNLLNQNSTLFYDGQQIQGTANLRTLFENFPVYKHNIAEQIVKENSYYILANYFLKRSMENKELPALRLFKDLDISIYNTLDSLDQTVYYKNKENKLLFKQNYQDTCLEIINQNMDVLGQRYYEVLCNNINLNFVNYFVVY